MQATAEACSLGNLRQIGGPSAFEPEKNAFSKEIEKIFTQLVRQWCLGQFLPFYFLFTMAGSKNVEKYLFNKT